MLAGTSFSVANGGSDATAPVLVNTIGDQSSLEDQAWSFHVPANTFTDFDSNPLTYSARLADGSILPDWLTFNAATRTFSGTPPVNFNGALDLKVIASDGLHSASDSFRLTVTPVNDAPIASPVTLPGGERGAPFTITAAQLLAGASDVDSSTLWISSLRVATGGQQYELVDNHNGTWTFHPDQWAAPGFYYTVTDGENVVQGIATVNFGPSASLVNLGDSYEDTPITITAAQLLAGVSDPERDTLTISSLSVFSGGGTLVNNQNGTWKYIPPANYSGPVAFDYTATDGLGSASARAVVKIAAVNDAPSVSL